MDLFGLWILLTNEGSRTAKRSYTNCFRKRYVGTSIIHTVFPHIVAAAFILFWKCKWGNYSREETIQRRKLLFYGNFWHFDITHKLFQSTSIDVFTTQNIEILAKILKKSSLFHGKVLRNIFLDSNDAICLAKSNQI